MASPSRRAKGIGARGSLVGRSGGVWSRAGDHEGADLAGVSAEWRMNCHLVLDFRPRTRRLVLADLALVSECVGVLYRESCAQLSFTKWLSSLHFPNLGDDKARVKSDVLLPP